MAQTWPSIWYDPYLLINAVDLSDHGYSATLEYGASMQNRNAFGDDTELFMPGLKSWSLTVEFYQDFAAGEVEATLWPLVGAAAFAIEVRPNKTDGVSATNPDYEGNAVLETFPIIDGSHGDRAMITATFRAAGTLARATS